MMHCAACEGNVFYEFVQSDRDVIDLSCLHCGKRWCLKRSHPLARCIIERIRK